jgi:N-dimethylarginine dimethylaminohydrolase
MCVNRIWGEAVTRIRELPRAAENDELRSASNCTVEGFARCRKPPARSFSRQPVGPAAASTPLEPSVLMIGAAVNSEILVSDATYFRIEYEINPYMDTGLQPDVRVATVEHEAIVRAHRAAGRRVRHIPAAWECPDMVYTANAAVVRGSRAVLGYPPPERKSEIPYFRDWLEADGFEVLEAPYPFSGQGDALACGELLLAGYGQRTDRRMHDVLADHLDYDVDQIVPLRTVSAQWYDLDLAVAVVGADTLAYHPHALDEPSRRRLESLRRDRGIDLVEVSTADAARFALNLVSDGVTVTMTAGAPRLAAALRARGFAVVELDTTELRKGGGGVRCTALTLDTPARRPR